MGGRLLWNSSRLKEPNWRQPITWKGVLSYPLPPSRSSTLGALLKLNLLMQMISCSRSAGPTTFWMHKTMALTELSCTKTTSLPYSWRTTGNAPVPSVPNTSTPGIFSLQTASNMESPILSIAQQMTWSLIFYQAFTRKEVPPIQEDNHELTRLNSP